MEDRQSETGLQPSSCGSSPLTASPTSRHRRFVGLVGPLNVERPGHLPLHSSGSVREHYGGPAVSISGEVA